MLSTELKKNIITALFVSSIALIIFHIAVNKFYKPGQEEPVLKELSAGEVNSRFIKAILNYGFDSSWIVTKKGDAVIYTYNVNVPPDIPIALLIKEIRNSFSAEEAELLVEEKKINGKNYLKIFSGEQLKLTSDFLYNPKISRKTGYAASLIMNAGELSAVDLDNLLNIPENFGVVLVPSKNSVDLSKKIINKGKEVIILLNDDISELEYKLGSDFSHGRIKDVLRTIAGTWPKAVFYLIDANSSLYNSEARDQIMAEFTKRNIKIIPTNKMIYYDAETDSGLGKLISRSDEKKLIAIPAESYLMLNHEVERVRKIGFKFVNPSRAVN